MLRCHRKLALPVFAACLLQAATATAASSVPPLDTLVVTGTRDAVERQIQSFVTSVTRVDGELIGRWRDHICPMVVGLSDAQSQFVQQRLIAVQNTVRKFKFKFNAEDDMGCAPNLFVIVTDEAEQVLESWKNQDPGMFRWKSLIGVSRSNGGGAVRTWHNAIVDSRIESTADETIRAVVVLVDTRAAGKVTLAQISDYVAMVSLAQIDLTASVGNTNSILRLFGEPRPEVPPAALTDWDFAFLNGLYRTSYSVQRQRRDIAARMTRALVPR